MDLKINKNKYLFILIAIFFLLNLYLLQFYKNVLWDSAVYIGMGKYIFSLGKIGLWEPSRPLVWSLLLGLLWKLNLNLVVYGRILELLFASGCIYLSYKIGKEIFNEKIALLSALLLAFTPTFFFFSKIMLSGIPAVFFSLLAIYLFIKKRFLYSGIFVGIAFMTRFLLLGTFISILIVFIYNRKKYKNFNKKFMNLIFGFLIILIPFLIFNLMKYQNPIYPFLLQLFMTKYTGLVFNQPFSFYFVNIIKENFILLFSLIGIFFIFRKKNMNYFLILVTLLVFFIFFNSIAHKEMRFIVNFLPYLCLISSYGFFSLVSNFKKNKIRALFLIIVILVWLIQIIPQFRFNEEENRFITFQNYVAEDGVKENIWITNPVFVVYSDKKIGELIYYPIFDNKKINMLISKLDEAEHILFNSCDLYCEPYFKDCAKKKADFIALSKSKFEAIFYEKSEECEKYIFKK